MLKREIKFENFNGEQDVQTCYFNLSKAELLELEVEYEGGLGNMLLKIVEEKDNKELIAKFKQIILLAYGEKSADGKVFEKSDDIQKKFSQTAAYQSFFVELLENEDTASQFLFGIMPKDMQSTADQDKPTSLPQRATPPMPPTS